MTTVHDGSADTSPGGLWADEPMPPPAIRMWRLSDPDRLLDKYLANGGDPIAVQAATNRLEMTLESDLPGSRRPGARSRLYRQVSARGARIEFTVFWPVARGWLLITKVIGEDGHT